MRVTSQCIQCIINVRLNEIRSAIKSEEESIRAQIELLRIAYEEFRSSSELTVIASNIYRWLVSNYSSIRRYYVDLKRRSIDEALRNVSFYKRFVEEFDGYEKFRYALKLSIAGNLLDTGVYGHSPPPSVSLDMALFTKLSIDHSIDLYRDFVKGGLTLMWLFDNAGESIYDTLLIDLLRNYGNHVIGVVKDDPGFQNDLTMSDAEYAGISKHVDKLVSTGYSGSSIHLERVSREFLEEMRDVDLLVAKGMAHYEYLSEVELDKPVAFLLIPKCKPIADKLGVERNTFVALYRKRSR